nr:hypothetical protein [Tanacetum cinerariifolium]
MQQTLNELTDFCTSLQRQQLELLAKFQAQELEINRLKERVKYLEDKEEVIGYKSRDDAPIKGRRSNEGEAAAEKISTYSEEIVRVLTSCDAANVLAGETDIPTGSGSIPTASPPATRVPTGKEELQMMIDGLDRNNESVAKYLQEYHQFAAELPIGRRIELISDLVKYHDNYAKVLNFQTQQRKSLQEATERFLYVSAQESGMMESKTFQGDDTGRNKREEVPEEKLKEMMELIPVEEVYVEALQVKHPIIDWEVHTEGERSYWKIVRLGGSTASYQFFVDLLKHFDREDLNQLWALVKETLNIRPATNDKEMELWVELKRLYEPDVKNLLLTHTQNLMHAPVEWKLYDACGVHHVISTYQEIFMLVEKDYPLRKGIPTASEEFLLVEQFPTANEDKLSLLSQSDATAEELCAAAEVKK